MVSSFSICGYRSAKQVLVNSKPLWKVCSMPQNYNFILTVQGSSVMGKKTSTITPESTFAIL